MQKTKIFFFGTPDIAVPSLKNLAENNHIEVVGVGVFPDRPVGRKQILTPCPVKTAAVALGLPIFEISDKTDLEQIFKTQIFDLGIVIAFGMIFPETVLSVPKLGVVNVHFSLLPKYRGASPVQSAILHGDSLSGITIQKMVKALDAGDICWQESYPISDMGTKATFATFARLTAQVLPDFVKRFAAGEITPFKQPHEDATFCGKFTKADGEIFPKSETAKTIYQKYLAFNLWPGIFIATDLGSVKIKQMQRLPSPDALPLECLGNTTLYVTELQIPGKSPQPASVIKNGYPHLFPTINA